MSTVTQSGPPVNRQKTELPADIIPPAAPSEFVVYLLARGDFAAARVWQALKVTEGRLAARRGELFAESRPAAWQRGYVEALQDLEA